MNGITEISEERKKRLISDINSYVNSASDISNEAFAQIIYNIITNGYISEQNIRDEFGLTSGAIDRWILGKNLPQIEVRKIILKWIFEKIC